MCRSCPDLYLLIRPTRRPLAITKWIIFIPGFIRSPPTLAINDIVHSLLLEGVGKDFPYS